MLVATDTQKGHGGRDEPRQGTRSILRVRRWPSRRQRMHLRAYHDNRGRIRPQRWPEQRW
jgi:hypothetical protein